ncbi:MAG: hypothetical protein JWN06_2792 [Propionibacteriaceae bacterium]|nr:hypothetical protein [Propionibacteriaceae bacterium]
MLLVSQVSGNGSTEKVVDARPKAMPTSANHNHLCVQNLSEATKSVCDVTGQLPELHLNLLLTSHRLNAAGQFLVEGRCIPVRQVWVDRPRFDRTIRMLRHHEASLVNIGADQHRMELTCESSRMS